MSWAEVSDLARSGPQLWPPSPPLPPFSPPVRAQGRGQPCRAEPLRCQSSCAPMQRLRRLSPPLRLSCPASLPSFSPPLRKGQAEGGTDAVSLPSIWCCMPLSGCQPAHSNEGCHQGYRMLERCLLLFASLSFFILFVQDAGHIYTTATRQPIISYLQKRKEKKKRRLHR